MAEEEHTTSCKSQGSPWRIQREREGGREGGREGEREGGRERGREGGREGERVCNQQPANELKYAQNKRDIGSAYILLLHCEVPPCATEP